MGETAKQRWEDPEMAEQRAKFTHAMMKIFVMFVENVMKPREDRADSIVFLSTMMKDETILEGLCLGGRPESKEIEEKDQE